MARVDFVPAVITQLEPEEITTAGKTRRFLSKTYTKKPTENTLSNSINPHFKISTVSGTIWSHGTTRPHILNTRALLLILLQNYHFLVNSLRNPYLFRTLFIMGY